MNSRFWFMDAFNLLSLFSSGGILGPYNYGSRYLFDFALGMITRNSGVGLISGIIDLDPLEPITVLQYAGSGVVHGA